MSDAGMALATLQKQIDRLTKLVQEERKAREEAEGQLRTVDAVLARRPALDKGNRIDNILHAINTAAKYEQERKAREEAEAECAALKCKLVAMTEWLETNVPEVFRKGLWDAIDAAIAGGKT